MAIVSLRFVEAPLRQSPAEEIVYAAEVKTWTTTPASPSASIVELPSGEDKTATLMVGSASVSGTIITLPKIKGLTLNKTYQVRLTFTDGGSNKFEAFGEIVCERK